MFDLPSGSLVRVMVRFVPFLVGAIAVAAMGPTVGASGNLTGLAAGVAPEDNAGDAISAAMATSERDLYQLANDERERHGLSPLAFDDRLTGVARMRAASQRSLELMSHFDPTGQLAFTRLLADQGIQTTMAGEALVWISGTPQDLPGFAHDLLIHSPRHLALLLEPRYDHLAVGAASIEPGQTVFAQIFSARE